MSVVWKVRLASQAELDFSEIITWTLENFGERQAEVYVETLTLAIEALHDGPEQLAGFRMTLPLQSRCATQPRPPPALAQAGSSPPARP